MKFILLLALLFSVASAAVQIPWKPTSKQGLTLAPRCAPERIQTAALCGCFIAEEFGLADAAFSLRCRTLFSASGDELEDACDAFRTGGKKRGKSFGKPHGKPHDLPVHGFPLRKPHGRRPFGKPHDGKPLIHQSGRIQVEKLVRTLRFIVTICPAVFRNAGLTVLDLVRILTPAEVVANINEILRFIFDLLNLLDPPLSPIPGARMLATGDHSALKAARLAKYNSIPMEQ